MTDRLFVVVILLIGLAISPVVRGDVVKPALIEISVYQSGRLEVEIRASIEALLTGINGKYKQTQDAPTADDYDRLRVLPAGELHVVFNEFKSEFLDHIWLKAGGRHIAISIKDVQIPEPGYTKVPRISVIQLIGDITAGSADLKWYYPASFGDSAVRVKQIDELDEEWHWSSWQWIRDDSPSQKFSLTELFSPPSGLDMGWTYLKLGFLHIFPRGADHILFILGIVFLTIRVRPLLWQVTMFTVAHTITLGLSSQGVITLPDRIIEPVIALSIAYIGIENLRSQQIRAHRLVLVFAFGLIHGLGFASVLEEFGLPTENFIVALLGFNLGVEVGQIVVVALVLLLINVCLFRNVNVQKWITLPGSALISLIGLYWVYDRVVL